MQDTRLKAVSAREAAIPLAASAFEDRNIALKMMADALTRHSQEIYAANKDSLPVTRWHRGS
jgi:gamma-glutamyl phosphate reductase